MFVKFYFKYYFIFIIEFQNFDYQFRNLEVRNLNRKNIIV